MPNSKDAERALASYSSPKQAANLSRFFKTAPGQYGEGDKFIGVTTPQQRLVANQLYKELSLPAIASLLHSPIHEYRSTALLMLVKRYEKGGKEEKQRIFQLYLKNLRFINNWDLVDLSAPNIVGAHLQNRSKRLIFQFSRSKSLFTRRISIVSTYFFIKHKSYKETLAISKILLEDKHDLIHKAVGWMLREVGKRNQEAEEKFLRLHCKKMPRTMLRYAIERFSDEKKRKYMAT